ncbi:MAG: PAS domain S-box protein [Candidatus Taylorbacteria bacterium]|nr:PAS domain S-box protein [Candidatus Taylorbacteria bacterium]
MNLIGAKQVIDSTILLDYVREGILVTDTQTRVQYANSAAKKILGLPDTDLTQIKLFDLVHPEDKARVKEYYQQLKNASNLITLRRMRRKDSGKYIIVERNATILEDGSTISILRDVTDRLQFEQRKDTFISIASHELRNPVSNISLYLEMAQVAIQSKDLKKTALMLQKISTQIERVNNLIGDMHDI